ncbi:MAG: divalent cation tolerance protein CutA [Flavobacteriales bacterium]|nr:divalent cation tolerance protein CutA [Flavobacteriales bacterium]
MVLLHILSNTQKQAEQIADFLIRENLLLEATLQQQVMSRKKNESGTIEISSKTLVTGKTKALLFNEIEKTIKAHFKEQPPVIYATPIAYMDWEQSKQLVDGVAKI